MVRAGAWILLFALGSACGPRGGRSTPAEAPKATEETPPRRNVEALIAAFNEPGCPALPGMLAPQPEETITQEQIAGWCQEVADELGHLDSVSPTRVEDSWEYYVIRAARGLWQMKLEWDDQGRLESLHIGNPFVRLCKEPRVPPPVEDPSRRFSDVTIPALPDCVTSNRSMDARPGDIDGDGDLDLIVAVEFGPNLVLMNDGTGRFRDDSVARLDETIHDSEDIALADLDGDGDLDLVFVSEDDHANQLYLNDGSGHFTEATDRLGGVTGESNAVAWADVDRDGDLDLAIGNAGQNELLINDGTGRFSVETATRLPKGKQTTQDLEFGDVDGDGDLDLVEGNEDDNVLLLNDGHGVFTPAAAQALPLQPGREETREADLGDVDGDGDLDLLFANVKFLEGKDPQNRLLINDGKGNFTDETTTRLPKDTVPSLDGDFADLDRDGDLDIITADWEAGFRVFANDGRGSFVDATDAFLPAGLEGSGLDIEWADFDQDGVRELYLANYDRHDYLLRDHSGPKRSTPKGRR